MNDEEFAQIVAMLKTFYAREEQLLATPEAIEMWYRMLKDIPAKTIKLFLTKWFATERWSPTVADIRKGCVEMVQGERPDWGSAWQEVTKAISKYGYFRQEEALASLSPAARRAIECIGWVSACQSEDANVTRAQFRQIYEVQERRDKEDAAIPATVKKAIDNIWRGNSAVDEIQDRATLTNYASHQQLCWTCKKSQKKCDWSKEFKPIEGWTARKVTLGNDYTYDITQCPEYEYEDVDCTNCIWIRTPARCERCAYHPDHKGIGGSLKETG